MCVKPGDAQVRSSQMLGVACCLDLSRVFLVMLTVAGWALPSVLGQTPAPQDTSHTSATIRTVTRAIVLDVMATDDHDESVHGLTRDDFTILEDGVTQAVASFDSAALTSQTMTLRRDNTPHSASPGAVGAESSTAQTVLVLDEMNSSFVDMSYARFCLNKFLHQDGGRLSQPTTLMALTNDGLVELHGLSVDGPAIWQALDRHRTALPWRQLNGVNSERERLNRSAFALHQIAVAGAGSNVRRNVVWLTAGFPLVSSSPFGGASQQGFYNSIRQLSDEMLRARVAVYTVDPRGAPINLISLDFTDHGSGAGGAQLSAIRSTGFEDLALERFARETGGRSFWGRNDINAEIARAMSEGATYYTLSYYPSNHNFDGRFRRITVKVNRAGVKLRTRAGYFAVAAPPLPEGEQLWTIMEEALRNPMPYTGLDLTATPAPARKGFPHLSLRLASNRLVWRATSDGSQECHLMAAVESFSGKGKPLKSRRFKFQGKPQNKLIGADSKANTDTQMTIDLELPSLDLATRLRVVVLDEATDNMGTADVEGPFVAAGTGKLVPPR